MSNLINCPKCGTLFIKKNRDICDKCFQEQLDLIDDIIDYVEKSPLENVHIKMVLEKFQLSMNELEYFITNCKLAQIEKKLVMNCTKCGVLMNINTSFSTLCKKCSYELKSQVLKGLRQ